MTDLEEKHVRLAKDHQLLTEKHMALVEATTVMNARLEQLEQRVLHLEEPRLKP